MKTYIIIFTLLNSMNLLAKTEVDSSNFKHLNSGCPENSVCSTQFGEIANFFNKSLIAGNGQLRKFFKLYGLPINSYNEINPRKKESFGASYNSGCEKHRKLNLFYTANFVKTTKKVKNIVYVLKNKAIELDYNQHFRPIYLTRKDKLIKFNVGVLDYPSFLDGNSIALVGEFNDHLFQYSVGNNQKIKLLNSPQFTNDKVIFSKKVVKCSKELENVEIPKYFSAKFCKTLLNIKSKKIEMVLDFKACP
jgi:hypothetical protein